MRRLSYIVGLLLWASAGYAVTNAPLPFNATNGPTNYNSTAITQYQVKFSQPVLAHNAIICWTDNNAGSSPSTVQEGGNNLTLATSRDDGGSRLHLYYRPDITDAPTQVNVNFAIATTYVHAGCVEVAHIALTSMLDSGGTGAGVCFGTATNAFLDCGTALNPTQDNDFVIGAFTQDDSLLTIGGFTAGTNFNLLASDNLDSLGAEYWVQTTAATIAAGPTATLSASHAWIMLGAIFKYAAGAGTEPSGMYIANAVSLTQKTGDTGPTIQFPCLPGVNAILTIWNGAANRSCDSTTWANATGTASQLGTGAAINVGSGLTQFYLLRNAVCSTTTTVALAETGGAAKDSNIVILGIAGAATDPRDSHAPCNTMNTDATGAAFNGCTVVSDGAGLMFWYIGAATGGGSAIASTSPGLFIGFGTAPVIDTSPVGENQGPSAYSSASAQSKTITWTPNAIAIGNWSDYGVNLLAAASSGGSSGKGFILLPH